jgi:hypothetical protein
MYLVLLQDGILCRHLSGPFDLCIYSSLEVFLVLIFCIVDLSVVDRELNSTSTTVLGLSVFYVQNMSSEVR